jgi:hypothetical protein
MVVVARWLCAVLGGVLIGAGLVLHGQVAMARYMQNEVDGTFFLWRAIGQATFVFQGGQTQLALAMSSVPDEALQESDRAGWVLVIVGSLIALTGPLLQRGKAGGRAPRRRAA